MEWRNPAILFWLIPASVFWMGCYAYMIQKNHTAREKFLQRQMALRLMARPSWTRLIAKGLLQLAAVVSLIVALAGPRFGDQVEIVETKGSDIYVLLDVSRSMLANDVPPTRLDRAKADITSLVNSLTGERVGLIAFAGQAIVKCPLTTDYEFFRRTLAGVDTNSAPRGGTAIGDAIRKALEVYSLDAQRHQAILLITDGEDHQSAPLEAAEYAAERNVKIFAVGLGDPTQGARIPEKPSSTQYIEYEGEQVWSKLGNSLLEQLATKTSGVYIPAETKSYDLSQVYANYLASLAGDSSESNKQVRRAEQYQWFLAFSIFAFLIDLLVKPSGREAQVGSKEYVSQLHPSKTKERSVAAAILILVSCVAAPAFAEEADEKLKQGLQLYGQDKFEEASEAFALASESFRENKDQQSYLALFDQACAEHRLGNVEKATDLYLQAAMSRDLSLAARAKFNLGRLHVEVAQKLTEGKEIIADQQEREKIVDAIRQAVAAYRHSVELEPNNVSSRRNLEIVRQWLKVTTDRWREYDLKKRREEADLIQFLNYMIDTQSKLLEQSKPLHDLHSLDEHAELKIVQDELLEEFPFLRDKIEDALKPPSAEGEKEDAIPAEETTQAIEMLQSWVDIARDHMRQSSRSLGQFRASESLTSQRGAVEELEKVWNAVSPFAPTLAKAFKEQEAIAKQLESGRDKTFSAEIKSESIQQQKNNLARSQTLAPKATAELEQLKKSAANSPPVSSDPSQQPSDVEPTEQAQQAELLEKTKQALEKAVQLAPSAVEEMSSAIDSLEKDDPERAWQHAEQARKILEEIAKAQPPPPNQNQQNQEKQEQNQQDQNSDSKQNSKQQDKQKGEQNEQEQREEKEEKDQDQQQSEQDKQKQKENKQDDQNKDDQSDKENSRSKDDKRPSQDRIAEALRKVREREAEKRERDKKLKARFFGKIPVEKDW